MDRKEIIVINETTENKLHYFLINVMVTAFTIFILHKSNSFNIISVLDMSIFEFIGAIIIFLIVLVIHEIVHILLFKLFGKGESKIKVEFTMGLIVIRQLNEKILYNKYEFIAILLAPYILITLILLLMSRLFASNFLMLYIPIILNCISSIIDIGVSLKVMLKCKSNAKVHYFFEDGKPNVKIL